MKRRLADATATDRVPFVARRFVEHLGALTARELAPGPPTSPLHADTSLSRQGALRLFENQLESRHVDYCARRLKKEGAGFYTISSAGHEGNAAVAAALRPTDPALLHYRSGAFFLTRAHQHGVDDPVLDVLLGATASADDPISGGRHKVFGSLALNVPPQTSTIGSHLPKAVGMAFGLERAKRLRLTLDTPEDAVIVCSFGDASANHSTSVGAINAACWAAFQNLPVPILFLCEDNGLGISVPTPKNWIRASFEHRPALRYFAADGQRLDHAYDVARSAVDYVRKERRPAFLHLSVVRLLGHAGSDVELLYRSIGEVEDTEWRDPLLVTAELLVEHGAATPNQLLRLDRKVAERVARAGDEAATRPRLTTAEQVMEPLAPRDPDAIAEEVGRRADPEARAKFWGGKPPETGRPAPLGVNLNRALGDLLVKYPELLIFGEDVAKKGGVYGLTRDLVRRSKRGRVFDTLLDEQTILGTAIGVGQLGLLPIAEIQYLAYLHNAADQLRGEAATLQFFSRAQFRNPMVVRIASYAYQKGFGGHFHNDNAVGALRDIPGLVIASPSRGTDAVAMLQTCVAAAKTMGSVCVFLEPIALYPQRDLHDKGDGAWCDAYVPAPAHVPIGTPRLYGDGSDLLIVSWANGLWMSLRAQRQLEERGVRATVMDLRWLAPLPADALVREANRIGRVLLVDETRASGGVSEGLVTALVEGGFRGPIRRVTAKDSFVPLGDAANLVLVQEPDIEEAAAALCET
ncbi:MAG TPA: MFS transporter [Polyangiaceae bacterium]|nr:MFS transporter [Polyangiaceae bacterium]